MLDIFGSIAALALSAGGEHTRPLEADQIANIREECALPADAKFVDARGMASADELATYLEAFDHPKAVVYGAKFADEDITVMLEKLQGGCLYEADLSGTKTPGGEFTYSSLILSSIEGADWSGMELDRIRFIGVNAKGANLAGANLRGGLWRGAYWKSNLEKADFSNTLMLGFAFECGITLDEACGGSSGANFSRADMSAADLAEFPVWGYDDFDKAFFESTRIHPRALANMSGIEWGTSIVLASSRRPADEEDLGGRITAQEAQSLRSDALEIGRDAPSFDCEDAGAEVEWIICGDYQSRLRKLDRDLDKAYAQYREGRRVSDRTQRNWLKRRNACEDAACVEQAYEDRIGELLASMGTELILAPDAKITFHQDVLRLSDAMRKTDLYARIRPVLERAAMQQVTLTGLEDGGIRIEGDAVGTNAHTCGWQADTSYDAKTGWYVARAEGRKDVRMFRVWGGMLTPAYSGNLGNTPDEAADFISCGARASFGEMQNLKGQ